MHHATPSAWTIAALVAAAPVFILLLFRMVTAKTSNAVAIHFALVMGLGLVSLVILSISGLEPSIEELQRAQGKAPKAREIIRAIPWEVFVAGAIWIIGGNYIHLRQSRKAGESWGQALSPFAPFARHMDRRSWLQLLLLALFSLAVAQVGLVRNSTPLLEGASAVRLQPQPQSGTPSRWPLDCSERAVIAGHHGRNGSRSPCSAISYEV